MTYESAQLSWNPLVSGASYEVQWRAVGAATWTVVSSITASSLRLTGLPDQTLFEWQVRTVCSGTITSDFASGPVFQTRCLAPTYVRTALINPVANVSNDLQWRPVGSATWTLVEGITTNEYSPAVWSCNRLPTVMDAVQVKHAITIQTNSTAKMLSIRYEAGGQLVVGAGATVQMGK